MAVEIKHLRYCVNRLSVVFEATYAGRTYPCLVPTEDLDLKDGDEAVAEFQKRLPDIQQTIETALGGAKSETDAGARQPTDMVHIRI